MKKLIAAIVAVFGMVFLLPNKAVHAENLTYTVSAQLPDNQIDKDVSYFALKVTPGATQNLVVAIQNKDSKEHKYRVSVNRAATNTNGVVDYGKHGKKADASLTANIETMTPKPMKVTVPAKTVAKVSIKLAVPATSFSGIALGGVRVQQLGTSDDSKKSGLTLTNKFAYVIGLQLQEQSDVSNVAPDMVLRKVKASQINYRNYVSAYIANTKPTIMHKLKVHAKVMKRGSEDVLLKTTKENMTMAPNSSFGFPISTNNNPLKAGKYTLDLEAWASDGKYHWHFTKNFEIKAQEANKLNKTAVDQKKPKTNWLMWLLIALAILILLVLLLILLLLFKRRKKDEDEEETK